MENTKLFLISLLCSFAVLFIVVVCIRHSTGKSIFSSFINIKNKLFWNITAVSLIIITSIVMYSIMPLKSTRQATVDGISMEPTIHDGEVIEYEIDYTGYDVSRGDILIYDVDGVPVIKRVIGLPYDIITIDDEDIYINGNVYKWVSDEGESKYKYNYNTYNLGEGEYFFVGDNKNNSTDSRHYGVVKEKDFMGKVKSWR